MKKAPVNPFPIRARCKIAFLIWAILWFFAFIKNDKKSYLKKKSSANVFPFKCDVTRMDSINKFKEFVAQILKQKIDYHIHLVIVIDILVA